MPGLCWGHFLGRKAGDIKGGRLSSRPSSARSTDLQARRSSRSDHRLLLITLFLWERKSRRLLVECRPSRAPSPAAKRGHLLAPHVRSQGICRPPRLAPGRAHGAPFPVCRARRSGRCSVTWPCCFVRCWRDWFLLLTASFFLGVEGRQPFFAPTSPTSLFFKLLDRTPGPEKAAMNCMPLVDI